jgi:hypothetical protein
MLYESDLKVYDIQDFCVNALKNSTDFENFCISTIGSVLNMETDSILNDIDSMPSLPCLSVLSGEESQDLTMNEWGHKYEIGMVFSIADVTSITNPNPPFTIDNTIKKYSSSRLLENLVKKAIITIKNKVLSSGINGDYDIALIAANGYKTQTGEYNGEINYVLSLTFNYLQSISKGC